MIRKGIYVLAMSLILSGCNGQIKKDNNGLSADTIQPKTDIRVNKEYDENGNLVRYDSSYSSYYSNIEGNTLLGDSIFNNFKNHFNQRYLFSDESFFDDYFFEDSLLYYDFYKNDFFSNRFRRNMEYMDQLFLEMDSIKNRFYYKHFPKPKMGENMNKE